MYVNYRLVYVIVRVVDKKLEELDFFLVLSFYSCGFLFEFYIFYEFLFWREGFLEMGYLS